MKNKFLTGCLLLCINMLWAQKEVQRMGAVEGKEGIYLFYTDEFIGQGNSKGVSSVIISRSDKDGKWVEIGKQKAVYDINALKAAYGNDFPQLTAAYLKLTSETQLIDYFKQHPALSDYGLLVFDLYFMQASGASYLDKNKPAAGTNLKYKVKYQKADGTFLSDEPIAEITVGAPLKFNRLQVAGRTERDSSLAVSWKAVNKEDEPFYFGNVYRQTGGTGAYAFVGKVMPALENDTAVFAFTEPVNPGSLYKYFVRATNMAGLEGNPSDTASLIAANFEKAPQLENFVAHDTIGGVFFSWTALAKNTLFSGIAVQRKPMSENEFISIDTIPLTSATYLDGKIIPNIAYQYQFRLVNLRWKPLAPSAFATAVHRTGNKNHLVPFLLVANPTQQGISLVWQKIKHYDVNGYYVYRSMNGAEYKLISPLVKDTAFTDADATDGRALYNYTVRSINYGDVQSEPSNVLQARPINTTIPLAPKGIIFSTEAGKVNLVWPNMKLNDAFIAGYFVYRAEGTVPFTKNFSPQELQASKFVKLNNDPVIVSLFTDTKTEPSKTYTYAVTSLDMNMAESNAEQLVVIRAAGVRIAAPSFFSLVKTNTGAQLSWDTDLNKAVTDYLVYRRERTEASPKLVATVKASQLNYLDTQATAGTFYFYSIKAKTAGGSESDFSPEKGIVR